MILGAHNCITYKKPKQWYLRPFAWTSKCQDKSIEELVSLGIKYFDFRIRFRDNKSYLCHGIMEYEGELLEILKILNKFEGIYVRIGYENIYNSKDMDFYLMYVDGYIKTFENIKFQICYKKPKWTVLINNFDKDLIEILETPSIKNIFLGPKRLSDSLNIDLYEGEDVIIAGDFIHNFI